MSAPILSPKEGAVLARLHDEPKDGDGWFHVDSKRYADDCRVATSTVGYALMRFRTLGLMEAAGWGASRRARITGAGNRALADFLDGAVKHPVHHVLAPESDRPAPKISGDTSLRAMVLHLHRFGDRISDWPGNPGCYRLNHYRFPVEAATLRRRAVNLGFAALQRRRGPSRRPTQAVRAALSASPAKARRHEHRTPQLRALLPVGLDRRHGRPAGGYAARGGGAHHRGASLRHLAQARRDPRADRGRPHRAARTRPPRPPAPEPGVSRA